MVYAAALLAGLAGYYVLPYFVWQWANLGVLRRGSGARPEIALTFDDGPDPATTPRVLDALEAAGARGTFFLLGEQALAHPGLARAIRDRGHEVACHGFRHRHAWLRAPWVLWDDIRRGADAIERATGVRPCCYRPPHGSYTLVTPLALRSLGLVPVHWTIEAHDWHPGFTPGRVRERVLTAMEPGSVVVLHDAGRGGANAADALPGLLRELDARGYRVVPLGQLNGMRAGGGRDLTLRLWQVVERRFDQMLDMDAFTEHALSLLRLARVRYAGPPLDLPDGRRWRAGDEAAELHLHSRRLQAAVGESSFLGLRMGRHTMRELARVAREHPKYRDVSLFYGVHLRPDAFVSLGWRTAAFPRRRRFLALYMKLLRRLHGSGRSRDRLEPALVWMDRETLLERYGTP